MPAAAMDAKRNVVMPPSTLQHTHITGCKSPQTLWRSGGRTQRVEGLVVVQHRQCAVHCRLHQGCTAWSSPIWCVGKEGPNLQAGEPVRGVQVSKKQIKCPVKTLCAPHSTGATCDLLMASKHLDARQARGVHTLPITPNIQSQMPAATPAVREAQRVKEMMPLF